MKKFSSIIITIALLLTSVFATNAYATDIPDSNTVPVVGVYNYSQTSPMSGETYFLGSRKVGQFTYEVNRYYGDWYAIFGLDLSLPCYKGASAMTLHQTMSKTYSAQLAYEFSHSVGGTADAKIFEITTSITNSIAVTVGMTFGVESGVSYSLESTAFTGYYKIGVCHDIYRHSVRKYNDSIEYYSLTDEGVYYDMPTPIGVPYHALLYSATSSSTGYRIY